MHRRARGTRRRTAGLRGSHARRHARAADAAGGRGGDGGRDGGRDGAGRAEGGGAHRGGSGGHEHRGKEAGVCGERGGQGEERLFGERSEVGSRACAIGRMRERGVECLCSCEGRREGAGGAQREEGGRRRDRSSKAAPGDGERGDGRHRGAGCAFSFCFLTPRMTRRTVLPSSPSRARLSCVCAHRPAARAGGENHALEKRSNVDERPRFRGRGRRMSARAVENTARGEGEDGWLVGRTPRGKNRRRGFWLEASR